MFRSAPEMMPKSIYKLNSVTNKNESYFTFSFKNPEMISRYMMHPSGKIKSLIWLNISRQWNLFWSRSKRSLRANNIYNEKLSPYCSCLVSFSPKSPMDWNLLDYSSGCVRDIILQCEDRFLEMPSISLQADKYPQDELLESIIRCESICVKNCSCIAYSYGSSTGCQIWTEDLLGLQQLEADDSDG